MSLVRDGVAKFLEDEGHRVEVSLVDEERELAEIVFRTRGQLFSVAVTEQEPDRLRISTAYEIPDWVREREHTLDTLQDIEREFPQIRFMLAHDDTIFVATIEYQGSDAQAYTADFWGIVARLREAGTAVLERLVDRSESKAAADKFIRQFMKGER